MKKEGADVVEIADRWLSEDWVKWKPDNFPEGSYVVSQFTQICRKTVIFLENDKHKIEADFNDALFITLSDTFSRPLVIDLAKAKCGNDLFLNWFLYQIRGSRLPKLIEKEGWIYEASYMKHYAIVTCDNVIDIIATNEPKLSLCSKFDK